MVIARRPGASLEALLEARRAIGQPAKLIDVTPGEFENHAARVYAQADLSSSAEDAIDTPGDLNALASGLPRTSDLLDSTDDAPVIRLINGILQEAIRSRASDIHIEPYEKIFRIRFRVDGILQEVSEPPLNLAGRLTARLKVMSRMDISERRVPQDGRIKLKISKNRAIDFRVNTCPTLFGEKTVLRILDPSSAQLGIDALGYEDIQKKRYMDALANPYGMILVTGPTGTRIFRAN